MEKTYRYKVGLLSWEVTVGDTEITIKNIFSTKIVSKDRIIAIGIADDTRGTKKQAQLQVENYRIELNSGPKGLCIVYYADENRSKKKDVAFTFDPADPKCLEVVASILKDKMELFQGIGRTVWIRAKMGRGGGDFMLGVIITAVLFVLFLLYMIIKR